MGKPLQVFCCYARNDQKYLYELKKHLMVLQREHLIEIKADINISPGTEWEQEINHHLETAEIILLLISADFINSDYCYEKEMQQAIARHERGTACVVPIIIRPTAWENTPFSKLQALPKDAKAVTQWISQDEAFENIAKGVRVLVNIRRPILTKSNARPVSNITSLAERRGRYEISSKMIVILSLTLFILLSSSVLWLTLNRTSSSSQAPQHNALVYQADWSHGMDHWNGKQGWEAPGDGTLTSSKNVDNGGVAAPYQPKTADYVVSVDMQVSQHALDNFFISIMVRNDLTNNLVGYICAIKDKNAVIADGEQQMPLGKSSYYLDTSWHTYVVVANATTIAFFIDGHKLLQVTDATYRSPGSIVLVYQNAQVKARNFRVFGQP